MTDEKEMTPREAVDAIKEWGRAADWRIFKYEDGVPSHRFVWWQEYYDIDVTLVDQEEMKAYPITRVTNEGDGKRGYWGATPEYLKVVFDTLESNGARPINEATA